MWFSNIVLVSYHIIPVSITDNKILGITSLSDLEYHPPLYNVHYNYLVLVYTAIYFEAATIYIMLCHEKNEFLVNSLLTATDI